MGIAKNGYYSISDIKKHNATYNIIYSTRSDGKSYAVKEECLKKAWKSKKASLGYVRRWKDDVTTELVNKYFIEKNVNLIEIVTKGVCDCIDLFRGYLWFSRSLENGKIEHVQKCGEAFALSISKKRYKSTGHPDITDLIFEEVFTDEGYLKNEPEALANLISTCARNTNITVWMIANTVSRVCPYITEWGLKNFRKQEIGTIDDYFFNSGEVDENGKPKIVKIAVERSKDSPHKSTMFFGNVQKSIQGGAWETHEFAHLPDDLDNFDEIYKIRYISVSEFEFMIKLLCHKEEGYLIVFVYPAKPIIDTKKHYMDRIVSGAFSTSFNSTPTLRKDLKVECIIHNLFVDNKICYSDNLTGEDFKASVLSETKYPF